MITIQLNGEPRHCDDGMTIDTLITQLALREKRLAVEINQEIVPRSLFLEHQLQDKDDVEIVQAIGGG